MSEENVLQTLVEMSRQLGDPARDYVILGEGNTSARFDAETFYVKASGGSLCGIAAQGFVRVRFGPVLEAVSSQDTADADVKDILTRASVGESGRMPSVETFLHALMLNLEGVNFVGHTHPTAVNSILCSQNVEQALSGRLFPDEIVCCGIAPAYIPFTDPGLKLARKVREEVAVYMDRWQMRPRAILMQNHGLIALGATPVEVQTTTAMWVKTARVLAGTMQFGGPHFLSDEQVRNILHRPDEQYRKDILDGAETR